MNEYSTNNTKKNAFAVYFKYCIAVIRGGVLLHVHYRNHHGEILRIIVPFMLCQENSWAASAIFRAWQSSHHSFVVIQFVNELKKEI